jgi:hypothetical protein
LYQRGIEAGKREKHAFPDRFPEEIHKVFHKFDEGRDKPGKPKGPEERGFCYV